MRLTIKRADLARLLNELDKVVEARNTIPVLSMVRLVAAEKLTATATDLDIMISMVGLAVIDAPGECCVSSALLKSIVAKFSPDAEISLSLDGATLAVVSGRSRFKLATLPAGDFPSFAESAFDETFEFDLAALLAPVKYAISNEDTRYYLRGIYLHPVDGNLTVVATDGHKLARNRAPHIGNFAGIIIPSKTVGLIPAGVVLVSVTESKIRVVAKDLVLTSKLIDGTYPDYQRVIPFGNDKIATVDNETMCAASDRVTAVSSVRGRAVKISINSEGISLKAKSDGNEASDEVPASYDGEPVEIGFNSQYLAETLAIFPRGPIKIALADSGSPALFTSDSAPELLAAVMPMRV